MTTLYLYAISWISFFDNILYTEFTYCIDETAALREAYRRLAEAEYDADCNENIKQAAFDMDGMINAAKVPGYE